MYMSSMSISQMSLTVALPMEALASTGQHRALASPAARRPRSLRGLQAAQALVKALSTTELNDPKMWHGAAGPMWYANPCTAGCSKAAVATTHVYARHVYTAAKVDLIKMTCDNWQCWVATVVDCYSDRCARAADELCLVIKWGEWAMAGIATLQSLNYAAKATTKTKSTVLKVSLEFNLCPRPEVLPMYVFSAKGGHIPTVGLDPEARFRQSHFCNCDMHSSNVDCSAAP